MGMALNVPDWAQNAFQAFGIVEHFTHFVTGDDWTATASNAGGVTELDEKGGVVQIAASDATAADNDETYLHQSNETFKYVADKPIYGGFRIQYAEADTDAANVAVGFKDAWAADSILDNGAGPAASYSGALVYKVDGETVWRFETSVGSTQVTSVSTTTAGGSAYSVIEIFVEAYNSTQLKAYAKVDGVQLHDSNGNPISHFITIGSATEMEAGIGLKAGSATAQTMKVDTAVALQKV